MSTKVQLQNGGFQDSEGNVLANGYLIMDLSQDATVTGTGNIAAGIAIRIQLDANGNVAGSPSQSVWGNDVLLPVNTFYRVTGYTAAGQPAWGPNNQQITGGSTFDLGTWVPNQVISWSPSVQAVSLRTNGTPNANQAVENLIAGTNITLTADGAGGTTIAASGGSTTPAGIAIIPLPPISAGPFPGVSRNAPNTISTDSLIQFIPGNSLMCQPNNWTITVSVAISTTFRFTMVKCTANTGTVLSRTTVTFGGLSTPTLGTGLTTSDSMAFPLSSGFDYYLIATSTGSGTNLWMSSNGNSVVAGSYFSHTDYTNVSPLVFSGGSAEFGTFITNAFTSA